MTKYTTSIILLLLSAFSLAAQDIQPVLQSGHGSAIKFYSVSYDKNILLTSDENEVMLWNTLSGKQLRRIPSPSKIRGAALCSNGTEVVVISYTYDQDAALRIYSSSTGQLLATIDFTKTNSWGGKSYSTLDELVVDKKNNRVAVRYFSEVSVVDISKREKLHHFELKSFDNDFTFTADADKFGITYRENKDLMFALIDTSGTIITSKLVSPSTQQCGLISDQQSRFYILDANAVIHVLNNQLEQVDAVRSDSVNQVWPLSPPAMSLSSDGKKLLVPLHKNQYLYDLQKKEWQVNKWKWVDYSTGLLFANENADKTVKVAEKMSVIIDTETGEDIHTLSSKTGKSPEIRFSPSGRMMSSFYSSTVSKSTTILDMKTGMQFNETEIDYAIFQWITDSVVLCAANPRWDDKISDFIHSVELRNVYTGRILRSVSLPKISSIDYAAISNDLKKLALVTLQEVFILSGNDFEKKTSYKMPGTTLARKVFFSPDSKKLVLPSEVIRIYDFASRKWLQLKDTALYGYNKVSFTPDSKELWYEEYKQFPPKNSYQLAEMKQVISVYDMQTGVTSVRRMFDTLISYVEIHPSEDLYAIGFFDGTVQMRKRSDDRLLYEGKDHNGHVDAISFAPMKKWMVSIGEDGLMKFRDFDSKQHIISAALLYAQGDRGYALLAPDNSYLVPASLINELHFVKDYDTYSFAQLDLRLNRPDKVLERLGLAEIELLEMHRKAYRRRLNKAGYFTDALPDLSSLQPLKITNRKQVSYFSTEPVLNIKLQTSQSASEIQKLNVYVNGQAVDQLPGNTSDWLVPVELNSGMNNIEVAYVSVSGMESLRERIEVKYNPAKPVVSKTYYIGVAVSQYKDSSMNLKYAVKDVADIASRYKEKDTAALTWLFTDTAVTKSQLYSIRNIIARTTVHDKVVLSFSGHGMLDTAYNFFFAGWDMNFDDPASKGISFNDINNLFAGIPARQKLVLIDACHSGEVDRDIVSFAGTDGDTQFVKGYARSTIKMKKKNKLQNTVKLMEQYFTDISKDNGANIISAAAGEEYALESSEWNNGVFSYSFIRGFFEKEADKDYNGKIAQSEIRKYMQQMVLRLTKGKQQPTSRSINSDFDWEL